MKSVKATVSEGLFHCSLVPCCDNSGAKIIKVITFKRSKTIKGQIPGGGVGDMCIAAVVKGKPDMRKQVVFAVIVRQKKEYRRPDGMRVKFEDNAAVVLKDDKGNPKGTMIKGAIAKEVSIRWPAISKIASIIV
jgi:large subunit ribosomal protein L14